MFGEMEVAEIAGGAFGATVSALIRHEAEPGLVVRGLSNYRRRLVDV